ncbi:MAG: histidinol dehydrogenase [Candidatus Bathyarchaeia archaeon]
MKVTSSSGFLEEYLSLIVRRGRSKSSSVMEDVRNIIESVKKDGDEALLNYTLKFDGVNLRGKGFEVPESKFVEARNKLTKKEIEALKFAAGNILNFHKVQIPKDIIFSPLKGVELRQKHVPLESVGVYAPGGLAPYPSTVLMCTIPARVAGVKNVVLCSPPSVNGEVDPRILVAAEIAGADKVYSVGGAQAVAALAYGTESIPKVDKIVGPGNIFVETAKLMVSMDVAVDLPAGPSEIVIIADEYANPNFIAFDLLAQAEHDMNVLAVLLTDSRCLAEVVQGIVEAQLAKISRRSTVEKALETNGFIIILQDLDEAVDLVNQIAPEHVEVLTQNPTPIVERIRNVGSIFIGEHSPAVLGDYSSGLNHVLPTGGYARTFSPLSVRDFMKTFNILECSRDGLYALRDVTIELARMEGMYAHAKAIEVRG